MSAQTNALLLLTKQGLAPSERNLTLAKRRVHAAGRLSQLGAHLVPGVLRARTVEYGSADMMAAGTIIAEVWLDARTEAEWQASARQLLELEAVALTGGKRLALAVHRCSWLDRMRERASWAWVRGRVDA